jgi:hypothetical protein
MTNEEIKNRGYGIEMIGKEMWVWDDDPEDACLSLVMYKSHKCDYVLYPYTIIDKYGNTEFFKYASDTNPNEPKQPKVGDIGYFWDDEESYLCSVLKKIVHDGRPAYYCSLGLWFTNFSKEKQPWMK